MGVVAADVGEDFFTDDGVELVNGGSRGDDDADVLFEAGPERHRYAVPWKTCVKKHRNGIWLRMWRRRDAYR